MKKKEDISNSDKELWAEYLKNPKDIFDKELDEKKNLIVVKGIALIYMDLLCCKLMKKLEN